ncbi:MAG: hypothetical protein M1825_000553 [Sarcosagium campestre]|nr:MAG: hypothetical protein M1825_000553 [Sarcosagium campestre]
MSRLLAAGQSRPAAGYITSRPAVLSLAKLLIAFVFQLPLLQAAPLRIREYVGLSEDVPKSPDSPDLWIYLSIAITLVLLGGAFAGLTIALMGQDDVNLQVVHASGEGKEKKYAGKVLGLLKRGKHWVLVTLLLSNVITNETLPIVLDRSLGGGWPAVLSSTVLIVIFGEIIPQAICVRYGMSIGALMAPFVLVLMYILAPVAWPTAKLLDYLLGEDHGTVYKKAGLKTLVTLHKTLGPSPHERLNQDEVTIISAVLDLKDKSVGSIMTPMDDVFTMSADTILDEKKMDLILSAGYSRIPIHSPDNDRNFVGMLLVKILITYDPEDCKHVSDFALATLPETRAETSCLDIVNFFQEGKSHMVLVSDRPGENEGALGVVTLEDVIEELIGEQSMTPLLIIMCVSREIIDESDVFVDVHKAIRRMTPAPKARIPKRHVISDTRVQSKLAEDDLIDLAEDDAAADDAAKRDDTENQALDTDGKPKSKSAISHYGSSPKATFMRRQSSIIGSTNGHGGTNRGYAPEMREQLKHLGPSNLASRPKQTRYGTVIIKPGGGGATDEVIKASAANRAETHGGTGAGLLASAGKDANDGVQTVQAGYGTLAPASSPPDPSPLEAAASSNGEGAKSAGGASSPSSAGTDARQARPGSIHENVVEAAGLQKVVLETTSSSSSVAPTDKAAGAGEEAGAGASSGPKKKRKRRPKKAPKGSKAGSGESTPLLK